MRPRLATIAREWGRIGCVGFGGPPAHIALLRQLCVERRGWIEPRDFEDAIAACNLLPGPASTQLAIFCAWRLRGRIGALVGGICFIGPGLVLILGLAALFLAGSPPRWILGAGAGAGAAVAAVAVQAGWSLLPDSLRRAMSRVRWAVYALAGAMAAATVGPWLVLVLLGCGLLEVALRRGGAALALAPLATAGTGGLGALVWVAFKVGALSFGGGFVIVPLMQHDAVHTYHWMTATQFLSVVALGQVTPGPVVATVSAVGFAARGIAGGLLAAAVAFTPYAEAGRPDRAQGVTAAPAATRDRRPDPGAIQGQLKPRLPRSVRAHVLQEAKLAARLQDPAQLCERCALVRHGAEHERRDG